MSEFLEPEELKRLAGCTPVAKQDEWLTEQGIPHRVVDGGRLIVSQFHVDRWEHSGRGARLPEDVAACLLSPDAEFHPAGTRGPVDCGVYVLWDEDGQALYIGKSLSVSYRVTQHVWAARRGARARFAGYSAVEVPSWLLDAVEVAHIHALAPPDNSKFDVPSWRFHEAAVREIRKLWGGAEQ